MEIKKNNIIIMCLLTVCFLCLFSCQRTQTHSNNYSKIVDTDSDYIDIPFDSIVKGTPYEGMTEEEFEKEMQKGVQGDLTLDQVDSISKELIKENYYMRVR